MANAIGLAAIDGDSRKRSAASSIYVPGEPSMWFFIIGDLIIFGVYFVSYMAYRGQNLATFLQSQQHLSQSIGVVNTVILLTSSLFVALGTAAARVGKPADARCFFGVAAATGSLFPLLKLFEWIPEVRDGLTPGTNLFFMFYYVMTGLHLVHVLIGLTLMGFVMNALRTAAQPTIRFVETAGLYWHMVDVLWLVLFALFYLMR
jgi:nitric oxide reductase NorE protein